MATCPSPFDAFVKHDLPWRARLLLLALWGDRGDPVDATRADLERWTSMSRKTITKLLRELEASGWLRVERRTDARGCTIASRYHVTLLA